LHKEHSRQIIGSKFQCLGMYALFISIFFFIQNSFIFLVGWEGRCFIGLLWHTQCTLFEVSRNALFSCSTTSRGMPFFIYVLFLCFSKITFQPPLLSHQVTIFLATSSFGQVTSSMAEQLMQKGDCFLSLHVMCTYDGISFIF
jgi:hypothetical protein